MVTGVLKRGSRGTAVRLWQEALNEYLPARLRLAEDGRYGRVTETATRAFQTACRLRVNGVVGPQTRAAIGPQSVQARHARFERRRAREIMGWCAFAARMDLAGSFIASDLTVEQVRAELVSLTANAAFGEING